MNRPDWTRLEAALVGSAAALVEQTAGTEQSWETTLARLTGAAADTVPGATYVGMTVRGPDGGLVSRAPSHTEVVRLDHAQSELDEGPCVDALAATGCTVVEVVDFATETRWPRFAAVAVRAGVRSALSHAVTPRGAAPGAVTLYGREPGAFADPVTHTIAGAFAMQAALAVYGAERIANLTRAVDSRDVIGRAKGILMERFGLDDQQAFDLLVHSSQDTNLKLVDVARWLSDDVATRHRPAAAAEPRRAPEPR